MTTAQATVVAATRPVSPVRAGVEVVRYAEPQEAAERWASRARLRIDADEPVFEGHYPDFPIFPGVCVVECVHLAALATAPEVGPLTLGALDSARFVGAVFPGDVLTVDAEWSPVDGGWRCAATASTEAGVAAKVRLRYRREGL